MKIYLELEKEASKVILESKKKSFKDLYNSINPTLRIKRIWGLIKAFQGKFILHMNFTNDPNAEELTALKEELIRSKVKIIPTQKMILTDASSSYNLPFSEEEFSTALSYSIIRNPHRVWIKSRMKPYLTFPKRVRNTLSQYSMNFFSLRNFQIPGENPLSNASLSQMQSATNRYR